MKRLRHYLLADILRPSFVALGVMLSLVWLMQSLRFLDFMVNKGLTVGTFIYLTLLLIPFLMTMILPLALFIGAVISFKRLNDDNELSSLFAAGLSRWRVIRPSLFAAFMGIIVSYAISLYFMPTAMTAFKQLQSRIRHSEGHLLLEEGTFNQIGENVMVYLKKRTSSTTLDTLLVHDERKEDRPVTWMARRGEILFNQQGFPRLKLEHGIRQEVTPNQVSMLQFKEHTLDISRKFKTTPTHWRDAQERYLHELINQHDLTPKQELQFKAEIHKRLMWPLTPLPLVLIAAVFLIRTRYNRHGVLKQVSLASITILLYHAALMVLHSNASRGMEAILYGQWLLPTLTSLICFAIILRKKA